VRSSNNKQRFTGQLPAEPWRQSAFGQFLAEGLAGAAHGGAADGGGREGSVTIDELGAFVSRKVDDWAWYTRGARQTPLLIGPEDGADRFVLTNGPFELPEAAPPPDEYPKWLRDGWEMRDRWLKEGEFRVAPRAYRALEAELTRAEQRWLGGREQNEVARQLKDHVHSIAAAVKPVPDLMAHLRPHSLAAVRFSPEEQTAVEAAGRELRSLLNEVPGKPQPEQDAVRKKFLEGWKKLPPQQQAKVVFTVARAEPSGKDRLRQLIALLPSDPDATYAETVLLKRIVTPEGAAENGVSAAHWRPGPFARLLEAVEAEERVVAGDPAAVAPHRGAIDKLAARRRDGEVHLLYEEWPEGEKELTDVRVEAENLAKQVEAIGNARELLEEAAVFLPACSLYVAARADGSLDEAWGKAVESAAGLYTLFNDGGLPSPEAVADREAKLRDALRALRAPFGPEQLKKLADRAEGAAEAEAAKPADLAEIGRLLDGPLPDTESRVRLALAVAKLAKRLTPPEDAKDDRRVVPISGARFSNVTTGLLRLAGAEGTDGRALRALPARLEKETGPAAVRLSVALYPLHDRGYDALSDGVPGSASDRVKAHKQWLRQRYLDEASGYSKENYDRLAHPNVSERSAEFFRKIAAEYE
jgi:hypothetical protein